MSTNCITFRICLLPPGSRGRDGAESGACAHRHACRHARNEQWKSPSLPRCSDERNGHHHPNQHQEAEGHCGGNGCSLVCPLLGEKGQDYGCHPAADEDVCEKIGSRGGVV